MPALPVGDPSTAREIGEDARDGLLWQGPALACLQGNLQNLAHHLLPAVDAEDLGGDVAVGHQVHGTQRAVLGVADAADRQALGKGGVVLLLSWAWSRAAGRSRTRPAVRQALVRSA